MRDHVEIIWFPSKLLPLLTESNSRFFFHFDKEKDLDISNLVDFLHLLVLLVGLFFLFSKLALTLFFSLPRSAKITDELPSTDLQSQMKEFE